MVAIVLIYIAGLLFDVIYIQSIGSCFFGELFNNFLFTKSPVCLEEISILLLSLVPVKAGGDDPSRKLTKEEKSALILSEELGQILVGLLLGDLYGQKQGVNARFIFKQGLIHKDYLMHLFELFKNYCFNAPITSDLLASKITAKVYSSIRFHTYSLPCFNELYESFYVGGKKVIPHNIGELLTPLGLAFWISDDGSYDKTNRAVILNTQSFTFQENEILVNVLTNKFNVKCTIVKSRNSFAIRISAKSLPVLQTVLKDIMPPMMLYKIGL